MNALRCMPFHEPHTYTVSVVTLVTTVFAQPAFSCYRTQKAHPKLSNRCVSIA